MTSPAVLVTGVSSVGALNSELATIVRDLKASGTLVTVRNVMAHGETPKAVVERWFDENGYRDEEVTARASGDAPWGDEFIGDSRLHEAILSKTMGVRVGFDSSGRAGGSAAKGRKSMARGALLGLVFPPAMFAYAAPIVEGVLGTIAYLTLTFGVRSLPFLGDFVGYMFVLPLNFLCIFVGLAYVAVHTATGKRTALFLRGTSRDERR